MQSITAEGILRNHTPAQYLKMANGLVTQATASSGADNSFLTGFLNYIRADGSLAQHYQGLGSKYLAELGVVAGTPACKYDQFDAAILGLLYSEAVVLIDMTKEDYPSALYTANKDILTLLAKYGFISNPGDLQKVVDALTGSRAKTAAKDGNFQVVRLDVTAVQNGNPVYKMVLPKSRVNIEKGTGMIALPLDTLYEVAGYIHRFFGGACFRFSKQTVKGVKTHIATSNPLIVKQMIAPLGDKMSAETAVVLLDNKIKNTWVGFSLAELRYKCYDMEASLYTVGTASFRIEMLNSVTACAPQEIDQTLWTIRPEDMRGIARTGIRQATAELLNTVRMLPLDGYPTLADKKVAALKMIDELDLSVVATLVKTYPSVFGNLSDKLSTRERNAPRILKALRRVEQGQFTQREVSDMMANGLVHIVMRKKSGGIYERYCSNNPTVLAQFLGKGYVGKFESPKTRLKMGIHLLQNAKSGKEVDAILGEYDIYPLATVSSSMSVPAIVEKLNESLEVLQKSSRELKSTTVIYRNVYADSTDNYFGQVEDYNIMSVEYAALPASRA